MSDTQSEALHPALLSPCFWPEVRRGGERFVRDLGVGLVARGQQPRLITSHPGAPRRSTEEGLAILRLPRPPHGPLLRRAFEPYVTHIPLTLAALHAGDYDLAHAIYPTDALAAGRWRRRTGRPAILSYLGIPTGRWLAERRRGQVLRAAIAGTDRVIALSRYAASAFERELGIEAPVIEPGVDLEVFAPTAPRARQPTIVCTAAVGEPRKQIPLLVRAWELVRREHADAQLILSLPRAPRAVRRAGLPERCPGLQWRALDDREALSRALSEAWVAVLPSFDEAFGLVLAEAMACGTPCVGFDDGAIPEVIDRPGVGVLFSSLTAEALAAALLETLSLSQRPGTSEACRARALELSVGRTVDRYLELYRQLLA